MRRLLRGPFGDPLPHPPAEQRRCWKTPTTEEPLLGFSRPME